MSTVIKRLAKAFVPKGLLAAIRAADGLGPRLDVVESNVRKLLRLNYDSLADHQEQVTNFRAREFKVYSQFGEDGLLLYIFSLIGAHDHSFVEFGIGDGKECNTANLAINFGWHGLLMDCSEENVSRARFYYNNKREIRPGQLKILQRFVTAENINEILLDSGIGCELDLLSIDIDGNDYWVWKAITVVEPRVVVIEYNASLGCDDCLVVKYDPNFDRYKKDPSGWYHGASLAALAKLAKSKDYILVGCDSHGVNALFVRRDAAGKNLTELSSRQAYYPLSSRFRKGTPTEQYQRIKDLDFCHG